ncbi:MAG: hypothetical protein ACR2NM_17565, partial [Bythopirellula sp.]
MFRSFRASASANASANVIPSERQRFVMLAERSAIVIPSERSDRGICVVARTGAVNCKSVT